LTHLGWGRRDCEGIYELLRRAGVEFGLLDREIYSGALLYELGLVDDFARYARRAAEYFKKHGVRRIITVDPHTHHVLEKIYPKYVEGFDLEVVSYLDLIKPGGVSINGFAIHDSCLYARFLGRYERIRQLLAAGNPVEDPYITGKDTAGCCGGPIESLFPEMSNKVVVQCPICYVNLKRAAQSRLEFYHIAEVLT
jgi:Fe-S oxidoreductase